jgi:kinesin family protein 6/9
VRSEVEYTQQLCDTCAQELAMEFNEWFSNVSGGEPSAVGTEDSNMEGDVGRSEGIASPKVSPSAKGHVARSAHSSVSSVSRPSIYASSGGDLSSPPASGSKVQSPSIPRGAARRPPAAAAAAASRPAAEDASDPEAAAFYAAQQLLIDKTTNVAHRPGSAKKNRAVATSSFGATPKRDILGLPMGPLP